MTAPDRSAVAVAPMSQPPMFDAMVQAVTGAGAYIVPVSDASALIWADPAAVDEFPAVVAAAPAVEWVQLPYAGIEHFLPVLDPELIWTCGKGVYADPVAEHVIALSLAGLRHLHTSIPARSWPDQQGSNLLGAKITVVGAGGITTSLLRLLEPWETTVTVVRRGTDPIPGAAQTLAFEDVHTAVADADLVVLAAALTDTTRAMVDAQLLAAMADRAWLINVARGAHVVTDDLVYALKRGVIAGAALDVTDPEPLPDDHPLWSLPNCIITPHVANTPEMGLPLLVARVTQNVRNWIDGNPLVGLVDIATGY